MVPMARITSIIYYFHMKKSQPSTKTEPNGIKVKEKVKNLAYFTETENSPYTRSEWRCQVDVITPLHFFYTSIFFVGNMKAS